MPPSAKAGRDQQGAIAPMEFEEPIVLPDGQTDHTVRCRHLHHQAAEARARRAGMAAAIEALMLVASTVARR